MAHWLKHLWYTLWHGDEPLYVQIEPHSLTIPRYIAEYQAQRQRAAREALGARWVCHPANHVRRLEKRK